MYIMMYITHWFESIHVFDISIVAAFTLRYFRSYRLMITLRSKSFALWVRFITNIILISCNGIVESLAPLTLTYSTYYNISFCIRFFPQQPRCVNVISRHLFGIATISTTQITVLATLPQHQGKNRTIHQISHKLLSLVFPKLLDIDFSRNHLYRHVHPKTITIELHFLCYYTKKKLFNLLKVIKNKYFT